MTAAVSIQHVSKRFRRLTALDDISFEVQQGEFFGLLGPNGAGKSTLINAMAGLVRSDSGQILVQGCDVVREYRQTRRLLGVVPQELVYDPFFTVREALRIQAGYFGLGRENDAWIDELISALSLSDKVDTNMRALSGGMKRRVLIAQALVHKPPVVVLDEPTAGVDVELRQVLWQFIRRLHGEGHTILLTTHYLEEAEDLCERIAILNKGRLVALDTKTALMACGIGRSLRVESATHIGPLPDSLDAMVTDRGDRFLELHLRRDVDAVVQVLDDLRAAGVQLQDIQLTDDSLEDVFVQITGDKQA